MTAPNIEISRAIVAAAAQAALDKSHEHGFMGALPAACCIAAGVAILRVQGKAAAEIAAWLRQQADDLEVDEAIGLPEGSA